MLSCAMSRLNKVEEKFEHDEDDEFDQMLAAVPDSVVDNRSYYWPSFVDSQYIYHEKYKFVYSFRLPTIEIIM